MSPNVGSLDVRIEADMSRFQAALKKAHEGIMDLRMYFFYRFEVAGEDDGTAWGEWDVFV